MSPTGGTGQLLSWAFFTRDSTGGGLREQGIQTIRHDLCAGDQLHVERLLELVLGRLVGCHLAAV
jgi:hypothetical protein